VVMRRATTLAGIEPGRVVAENEFGEPFTIAADAVVLVTQRVSRDRLYHELDGTLPRVHRIGDCVAPRILAEVVFDGHRMAREIDQPDPDVVLPYLRERPMQDPPPAPAPPPPALALPERA
jgi:dimethylamine/trimethylamine dehydrogenase